MPADPIAVLIVNDSPVAGQTLRRILLSDPRYRVVGIAADGFEAERIACTQPVDLVLMDIHMPGMNGVEATRRIMARCAVPILIVTATVTRHMDDVFECLRHGALEAIKTPGAMLGQSAERSPDAMHLLERIGVVASLRTTVRRARGDAEAMVPRAAVPWTRPAPPTPSPRPARGPTSTSPPGVQVVAIGASTGGPTALAAILRRLPRGFSPSVLIVQHIEASFTRGLAEWLAGETPLPVVEAAGGEVIGPGRVYLARGGEHHLVLSPGLRLAYEPAGPGQIHAPSVDRLFETVARACGASAVGVLCTGMGEDGARGLLAMHAAGSYTIAQDRHSSLIYGMPGTAVRLGAVRRECHLDEIAPALLGLAEAR
jgi:chemotaxis response regulator CheB